MVVTAQKECVERHARPSGSGERLNLVVVRFRKFVPERGNFRALVEGDFPEVGERRIARGRVHEGHGPREGARESPPLLRRTRGTERPGKRPKFLAKFPLAEQLGKRER